jgi:cyclase
MNKRLSLAAMLGVALMGSYAYAQFGDTPAVLDTIKVRDDLFVIHNAFVPGNTTVLVTSEGVLLVDDKFPIDVDNIIAQLKKITSQPVRYVVNTHYHADHSGGNPRFQAVNAQVIASARAREKMVEGRQPGLPNVTLEDRLQIYLGGKRVEVHHFGRAHTDGDVVVYFPDHRALAAGDMFTVGDDVPQLVDYAGGGSARDWTKTLDGVLQLDFDTVVPGHGPVATKAEMRTFRETTVALRTRVREMIVQKRSRDDISKMLRGEFKFADFHIQASLDGLLVELAPGL